MHHSLLLDNNNRTGAVDLNNAVDVNAAMLTRCHVSAPNIYTIEERFFVSTQAYCCRNHCEAAALELNCFQTYA